MMFYTHLIFAFFFSLISVRYLHPNNQILFVILVLIGGSLPDLDHPNSKLGRYFKIINMFLKHRGILHSLLVLPIISLLLYYFDYGYFSLPIIVGYFSHLVGDAITKEGIKPFHPISSFRVNGFIRVGGFSEVVLFIVILFLSGYFLFTF